MTTNQSSDPSYHVLVPVSDNETSAQAQTRFVASLPNASTTVEATLTHVLHGEELDAPRELRSAQRVGTVVDARDYLQDNDIDVQIMDVEEPFPPTKGIIGLGDKLDADLIVLGGGMHSLFDDLLSGHVAKSVGQRTHRPITVVPESFPEPASDK